MEIGSASRFSAATTVSSARPASHRTTPCRSVPRRNARAAAGAAFMVAVVADISVMVGDNDDA